MGYLRDVIERLAERDLPATLRVVDAGVTIVAQQYSFAAYIEPSWSGSAMPLTDGTLRQVQGAPPVEPVETSNPFDGLRGRTGVLDPEK